MASHLNICFHLQTHSNLGCKFDKKFLRIGLTINIRKLYQTVIDKMEKNAAS